jgi:hypothetical protein
MRKAQAAAGLLLALVMVAGTGCSKDSAQRAQPKADLAGVPAELLYPGAVVANHTTPTGSSRDDTFFLRSGDGFGAVADFYRKGIAGWAQVHAIDTPQSLTMVYQTPDQTRRAWVVITHEPRDGQTSFSLTLAGK